MFDYAVSPEFIMGVGAVLFMIGMNQGTFMKFIGISVMIAGLGLYTEVSEAIAIAGCIAVFAVVRPFVWRKTPSRVRIVHQSRHLRRVL